MTTEIAARHLAVAYSAFMAANNASNYKDKELWGWMLAKAQIESGVELVEPRLLGQWGMDEYTEMLKRIGEAA